MRRDHPLLARLRRLFQSRPFGDWEPGGKVFVAACLVLACAGAVLADQVRLAVNGPHSPPAECRAPERPAPAERPGDEGPDPAGLTPPADRPW